MKSISSTSYFDKRLAKRIKGKPQLKKKVSEALKKLQANERHSSLKLHKLKGERAEEYAFWIEGDLRIVFLIIKNGFLLVDILTHDEY